ncbi:MAG: TlyA family RNA methyltransferase [Deltaproteobacteria bacterium]|nr:MAG: TlyA family RNA methyltransferase [Deltaproteobacteria bacterium]
MCRSRERARALIMAGNVLVDDVPVTKAGTKVAPASNIRLRKPDFPYVSRGGVKLSGALDDFGIGVEGMVALDAGASTGGFTDCLLQRGARRVYAVDVGRGQLHEKLRRDPRVVVKDRTNLRNLTMADIGEPVDMATLDLSFISLRLVLGPVKDVLVAGGKVVALVKPQFELRPENVGKGGIVRSDELRWKAVDSVIGYAEKIGFRCAAKSESRLAGADGNREIFILLEW